MSVLLHCIDGTRADWPRDGSSFTTAVQRICKMWKAGPKSYQGGPATDYRGIFVRTIETLFGANRRARLDNVREHLQLHLGEVEGCVFVGWSRGGHEVILACETAREIGIPVLLLLVYDPVPASGLLAAKRIVPFLPLQTTYPRPAGVRRVVQVLAGENYSRLTRHARIDIDPKLDPEPYYVPYDHRGTQNALGLAHGLAALRGIGIELVVPAQAAAT